MNGFFASTKNTGTSLKNYEAKKKQEMEQKNERKKQQDIESFKEI